MEERSGFERKKASLHSSTHPPLHTQGIGTSSEVKVKWKRSGLNESHSDDSLYKLLVRFGAIKSVEMTGVKVKHPPTQLVHSINQPITHPKPTGKHC